LRAYQERGVVVSAEISEHTFSVDGTGKVFADGGFRPLDADFAEAVQVKGSKSCARATCWSLNALRRATRVTIANSLPHDGGGSLLAANWERDPAPLQIVRAFVGRLEMVTPATARAVETALVANDQLTLDKYGRFLEPFSRA
jgi:hypothetical protein